MTTTSQKRPASRREALRDGLQLTARRLKRREAYDVPAGYIDNYLALDWLEWKRGTLHLTIAGEIICRYFKQIHQHGA